MCAITHCSAGQQTENQVDVSGWNRSDPLERAVSDDGQRESKRANQALRDYVLMGPARSLRSLRASYVDNPLAPTCAWQTLSKWSVIYNWVDRADCFDDAQARKQKAEYDARRREIMETGLALDHERVEKLKQLHTKLDGYLADEDHIWIKDKKSIRVGSSVGMGDGGKPILIGDYEVIDLVSFNAPLIGKILETIEALAAETGGRVRKTELTGKNGGPIRTTETPVNLGLLSDDELEELEKLTEKAAGDANINAGRGAG